MQPASTIKKPTDLSGTWFKQNTPKGLTIDPNTWKYLEFVHAHHIHYPKLNVNSKDEAVMRDRVNQIRQMTIGIKKSSVAMNAALKKCKDKAIKDGFITPYLVLLRKAEMDRQNWIKIERGVGNTAILQELIMAQGLNAPIKV